MVCQLSSLTSWLPIERVLIGVSMNLDLDIVCEHPDGNWEVNQEELDYVVDKHRETRDYA